MDDLRFSLSAFNLVPQSVLCLFANVDTMSRTANYSTVIDWPWAVDAKIDEKTMRPDDASSWDPTYWVHRLLDLPPVGGKLLISGRKTLEPREVFILKISPKG